MQKIQLNLELTEGQIQMLKNIVTNDDGFIDNQDEVAAYFVELGLVIETHDSFGNCFLSPIAKKIIRALYKQTNVNEKIEISI